MKVTQEPDRLNARVVRWTAIGLLLGAVVCAGLAMGLLWGWLGTLAPPRFVAGRHLLADSELRGIELGLLPTQHDPAAARGRPAPNPISLPERRAPAAAPPLDQVIDAYLGGARAPRGDGGVDYGRIEAGPP